MNSDCLDEFFHFWVLDFGEIRFFVLLPRCCYDFDIDSSFWPVLVQLLEPILRRLQRLRTLKIGVQVIAGCLVFP